MGNSYIKWELGFPLLLSFHTYFFLLLFCKFMVNIYLKLKIFKKLKIKAPQNRFYYDPSERSLLKRSEYSK